jgi:hypothetical protein
MIVRKNFLNEINSLLCVPFEFPTTASSHSFITHPGFLTPRFADFRSGWGTRHCRSPASSGKTGSGISASSGGGEFPRSREIWSQTLTLGFISSAIAFADGVIGRNGGRPGSIFDFAGFDGPPSGFEMLWWRSGDSFVGECGRLAALENKTG